MPSVTQGEITEKIITLDVNYQNDFSKTCLSSLGWVISLFAIYKNRFVGTVITTSWADFHSNYIGERNERRPIFYIGSLIFVLF